MSLMEKWDRASRTYDLLTFGEDLRQGHEKRRLYAQADGKTLLVAVGTGRDFKFLPAGLDVLGIDISTEMLKKARRRAEAYDGRATLRQADVQRLDLADRSFATVITACTFCSVPNPVRGLREVYRVLEPGGRLLMFEHVRSELPMLGLFLDALTYLTRKFGPDMNRDTETNVRRSGFEIEGVRNVYVDIVKAITARRPLEGSTQHRPIN